MIAVQSKSRASSTTGWIVFGLLSAGIVYLYGIRGNTQEVWQRGTSAIMWMIHRWQWEGSRSDFSHAWLIPPLALFVVWRNRRELFAVGRSVSLMGLTVVAGSLFLHWVGVRAQLTRVSLFSLVCLLWGMPFYLWGRKVARILLFPCAYLILCIPMSFLDSQTVPLRIMASALSAHILHGLGIRVARAGTIIRSLEEPIFQFGVADPCSGLNYLVAMVALTAIYAYFTQKSLIKKWILFASAVPLAVAGNVVRIVTIALIARAFGWDYAQGVYESFSGVIVFAVAVLLMTGLGKVMEVDYNQLVRKWKKQSTDTMRFS